MQTHINIFGEDANGVHINKINDDYLARYSEKVVGKHRDKEELDHPDGSVHARHIDTEAVTEGKIAYGAVTRDKIKSGEVTLECLSAYVKDYIGRQGWATMVITKTDGVYKSNSTPCQQGQIIVVRNETGGQFSSVTIDASSGSGSGSPYTYIFDRYIGDKEVVVCRWAEMGHSESKFETIMTLSVDEKVASSDILDDAITTDKIKDKAITLEKIADGAIDETPTQRSDNLVTSGGVWEEFFKTPRLYTYSTAIDFNEIYDVGIHDITVYGSTNTPTNEGYWKLFCFNESQIALSMTTGILYSRIIVEDNVEQITYWGDWSEISTAGHTHEEFKELSDKLNTLAKAIEVSKPVDVSVFAEEGRITLITYNPEIAEPITECIIDKSYSDGLYYIISQPIEAGKTYLAVTTKAHEINDTSYIPGELQLYPLEGASITVDSELSDTSTNPVQNKAVTEIVNKQTTQKAIYVQCDGDHDELKLQNALTNASSGDIVYPVGDCIITNENTVTTDSYVSILNIAENVTVDGRYCGLMKFKNTTPANKQIIFNLGTEAKLKNIYFTEEDCTIETINPTLVYAGKGVEVSDCYFTEIYDNNQIDVSMYGIYLNNYCKFLRNRIDGYYVNTLGTNCYLFRALADCNISDNVFENITAETNITGRVLSAISCNVNNNVFSNINTKKGFFELKSIIFRGNRIDNCSIRMEFSGIVNGCRFVNTSNVDGYSLIELSNRSNMGDCTFHNCTMLGEGSFIYATTYSSFVNNVITSLTVPDTGEIQVLLANKANVVSGNVITTSATENAELYIVDGDEKTICTSNVTNHSSIGRFAEDCVESNNITGA